MSYAAHLGSYCVFTEKGRPPGMLQLYDMLPFPLLKLGEVW
jgi:hypothetical protein